MQTLHSWVSTTSSDVPHHIVQGFSARTHESAIYRLECAHSWASLHTVPDVKRHTLDTGASTLDDTSGNPGPSTSTAQHVSSAQHVPTGVRSQAFPPGALPAHAVLPINRDNKRPLSNSPEDSNDPQWKRVRFGAQASCASTQLAGALQPKPEPSTDDFPVVEAVVRREGTDKFKRVQVDGQMNAAERDAAGLVCPPGSEWSWKAISRPSGSSVSLPKNDMDEGKKICPQSAVDQVLAGLGADEDFAVDGEVKVALGMLAENMLEETMEFAALMASRRNSKWLQAKDLECYLERMWHISLPGFSSRCVTAVPKIGAESAHMKNRASVRSYLAQLPVQQPSEGEKNDESAAATVG